MAGKKDGAGRDGQARCLAEDRLLRLQSMIDEGVAALAACPLKPGDVLGIERKTRAIGAMARSIKLVDGLRLKPGKSAGDDHEDQDMNHDGTGRGDAMDPAQVAALRAELESRLDWIRTVIEKKRMAGRTDGDPAASTAGPDAETA